MAEKRLIDRITPQVYSHFVAKASGIWPRPASRFDTAGGDMTKTGQSDARVIRLERYPSIPITELWILLELA